LLAAGEKILGYHMAGVSACSKDDVHRGTSTFTFDAAAGSKASTRRGRFRLSRRHD
jgi:hypothetical protein